MHYLPSAACIVPRDHNLSAINHVRHDLADMKWFIVAPWTTLSCALTLTVSGDLSE